MQKDNNYLELKKFCADLGADLFGVAGIEGIKNGFNFSPDVLKKLDNAVCFGMRLCELVLEELIECPTRLYSYHYRTVNLFLDQIALKLTVHLRKRGYLGLPVPASQVVDWKDHTGHLSHRYLAYLAGIGWIGRNNLLVSPEFGSQVRLITVLTDMPLKNDVPLELDCGKCRRCVDLCPAAAIKENPADFDRAACLAKLKEFQKKHIVEQYICGVCVNACPPRK